MLDARSGRVKRSAVDINNLGPVPGRRADLRSSARVRTLVAAALILAATLAGCGGSSPTPDATLSKFARCVGKRAVGDDAGPGSRGAQGLRIGQCLGVRRTRRLTRDGHGRPHKNREVRHHRDCADQREIRAPQRRCLVDHEHRSPGQAAKQVAREVDTRDDRSRSSPPLGTRSPSIPSGHLARRSSVPVGSSSRLRRSKWSSASSAKGSSNRRPYAAT